MPFGFTFVREAQVEKLKEEMSLLKRQMEDIGWINLGNAGVDSTGVFSQGFKQMLDDCRTFYYKNPLIGLWVQLTTQFVFGEGISDPKCESEEIQEVVDAFWQDPDNIKSFTSFGAQQALNAKLMYEGNLFFMLFTDDEGDVRVRVLNTREVDDIICDAEDRMRPDFYKTKQMFKSYNYASGSYQTSENRTVYYPSIEVLDPESYEIPENQVKLDCRVFHVKINCDVNDKYGIPEIYRGIDWVTAHKNMAGDLATLVKSLSTVAWKKKVKGTASQVASIASALQSRTDLKNIKNTAGQTIVENEASDMSSININTGGVKIGTDGLRQMKLMVCAASNIYEHYYGDPSTGNLATAKTMELPMIKKFVGYQSLWSDIYKTVLNYQIDRKIEFGLLSGTVEVDVKAKREKYVTELDRSIDIDFPPILEEELNIWADALVKAKDGGLVGKELAARLFMLAANVNNIDEELKTLESEWEEQELKQQQEFEASIGMQDPNAQKAPKAKPGEPVKEADEIPAKRIKVRSLKKENYVMQKMNGYRKVIMGHFRKFQRDVKESAKISATYGLYVGDVKNFNTALATFTESMKEAAKKYYPLAVEIGEKFMQANLKDINPGMKIEETLYEAKGRAKGVLDKRLYWNEKYLSSSLEPAIVESFHKVIRQSYTSPEEFKGALAESLSMFESRIELYVGAFWTVEQEAVKEAARGTGVMVNFVGPDDDKTCEGCEAAVAGSPWAIDDAPIPGEQECLGRCRHALQIVETSEIAESYALAEDKFSTEIKSLKEGECHAEACCS